MTSFRTIFAWATSVSVCLVSGWLAFGVAVDVLSLQTMNHDLPLDMSLRLGFGPGIRHWVVPDPSCLDTGEHSRFLLRCQERGAANWAARIEDVHYTHVLDATQVFRRDLERRLALVGAVGRDEEELLLLWLLPQPSSALSFALARQEQVIARGYGQTRVVAEWHAPVSDGWLRCRVYDGVHGRMSSWIGVRHLTTTSLLVTSTWISDASRCDAGLPVPEIFAALAER